MKKDNEIKVVRVTPEDHEYIEELYKKITDAYKSAAALAGVKTTLLIGPQVFHRRRYL